MTRFIIITDGRAVGWHHDGSISLWDIENRNCYSIFKGHKKFKLYFSGLCKLTSTKIVSWAEDRVLKLWDFELNKCLKILKGGMAQIKGVLNLLNDRLIAWDENGSLHLWDLENGKHLKKIKAHADSVAGVKLVADNSVLSWCGGYENEDFSLRQWDLESGECLQTLVGHTDGIIGVHLLNGGLVLSWSSDDTLRLWNLDNGQCLEVYQRNRLFSAPKEIWQAYLGECQTNASAGIDAIGNVSLLGYEHRKTGGCVQWNGSSECTARNLFDDGHAIFTQANGQVCFLCLWQGNRRTMLVDFV
jgi:WD40 repeat protein